MSGERSAEPGGDVEILVYGGTAAGVCAAVAAASRGARVVLLEPGQHVGGMTSGGLGYTDIGDLRVVGGPAARFRQDVADHYGVAPGRYAGPEPRVAEAVLRRWLEEAGVEVVPACAVESVERDGGAGIAAVRAGGRRWTAGVFVDAGYEGDVLALAGVPYRVGRESRRLHGEHFAGRREPMPGKHSMPPGISPFLEDPTGHVEGQLVPQVRAEPLAEVGDGDGGVMSYGYRVCLTPAADRLPVERRPGYDDARWELGRRLFHHWRREGREVSAQELIGLVPNLPGGKCDANSIGPFSLSLLDGSAWEYPEADAGRREAIRLHHLHHAQDFLWFLTHDPAVPRAVRAEMARWGLPPEEFTDTGHLPHQLYVREARRMVGQYVLTEHDAVAGRMHDDVVAMGSYHLDVREVQRVWRWVHEHPRPVAMVVNEGYYSVPVPPYAVPYRSLVPRAEDCTNLLVPVCVSASHVALSSVRMEVQYQMLGHAAGVAAVAALHEGCSVQEVDVAAVQADLRAEGQVLSL